MPLSLLWGRIGSTKVSRDSSYRAPSWSWASLDGTLAEYDHGYTHADSFCRVIDVSITPSGLDPFGEVSDGMIKLCGQLKVGWRILDHMTSEGGGDGDTQLFYGENRRLAPSDFPYKLKLGFCELDAFDTRQALDTPEATLCFRITRTGGLVLQKLDDGRYQRIGLFELDDDKTEWYEDSELVTVVII